MGQWSCLEFRFLCVLGGRQTPQDGLQGVDGICDASLASRDCTLSTGEHKRVRNRMNSSKRFTVRYIGLCLASIVTLERCRRSCGGALSRNLHRGSINL